MEPPTPSSPEEESEELQEPDEPVTIPEDEFFRHIAIIECIHVVQGFLDLLGKSDTADVLSEIREIAFETIPEIETVKLDEYMPFSNDQHMPDKWRQTAFAGTPADGYQDQIVVCIKNMLSNKGKVQVVEDREETKKNK